MDQVALTFLPGVLIVRTGQPVEFRNSDDVLHNVRVSEDATKAGTFNVAIPIGEDYRFTFERDGFHNVGCDIHPGMAATIYSSQSPYSRDDRPGRPVRDPQRRPLADTTRSCSRAPIASCGRSRSPPDAPS